MNNRFFQSRLSLQDQAFFARRLAMLVKAGVPILESLRLMQEQTRPKTARFISTVAGDVANGLYLHKSMGRRKGVFGEFAVNITRIGELSGTLPENLLYLADEMDKKRELRKKMISALLYPAAILVSSLGVTVLLTVYLFPKLLPVFKSLNVPLPFTTRALIATSDFFMHYGWLALGATVAAVIVFILLLRIQRIRFWAHRILLRMPFFGSFVRNYHLTNMCRTLGILLTGKVTAVEAVIVTANTSVNLVYRQELHALAGAIIRGAAISGHLKKKPRLFPPLLYQLISVGERTGSLSKTLLYLATMYEKEFDEQTRRVSTVLEPALMIVMGLLVGFVAISIITPIYGVTQHLQP